jgi:cytochrome P450 / NADPH-cytochrome P450 reductase
MFRGRTPGGNVEEWLNSLVGDGRYVEDVCAVG